MTLYTLVVTLHLLAALFWLGGMFFFAVVGAPVLRRVEPEDVRRELFARLGEAFRGASWVSIAILVATGLWNLHLKGMLSSDVLGDGAFWATAFGRTLSWKLALVTLMLAIQAVHDFGFGPRAGRAPAGSPQAALLRRRAAWLARLNSVLGIVLVYVAVRLGRGG